MTYQVTYSSPAGHAEQLAHALKKILPPDTPVLPLTDASYPQADVQIVGFEMRFADLEKPRQELARYLKLLTDKTVLLFGTLPVQTDESQNSRIHRKAAQALPADCDYRGLFLSLSQPSEQLLAGFHHALQVKPDNSRVRHWCRRCEMAVGHPNRKDEADLCRFAAHVLNLSE